MDNVRNDDDDNDDPAWIEGWKQEKGEERKRFAICELLQYNCPANTQVLFLVV